MYSTETWVMAVATCAMFAGFLMCRIMLAKADKKLQKYEQKYGPLEDDQGDSSVHDTHQNR